MLRNTVLPALTLGFYVSGIFARFLRASLVAALKSDYVRTSRAKGLRGRAIIVRHVMRNALLPFITIVGITIVGIMLAGFVGGAAVTESVFTYPGLGRLLVGAIGTRDYPVIVVGYVLINLIVDVLCAYIDPRIEH